MEPELVADYACVCGENPLWHPVERKLYWTDIPTGRLFRYDPATGAHEQFFQGDPVGGFTIQDDGGLLLFMARGAIQILKDGVLRPIFPELPDEVSSRFNDVIADPAGRVFCGTMSTPDRLGRLYRLDTEVALTVVVPGVSVSNGMAFTLDREHMYFTDSGLGEICLFDYDVDTGNLSGRRLFLRIPKDEGVPDGMTVDAEGFVWSARWDGSCLVRYDPQGREERRIHFPARKVSSVIFGGPDYRDIYVTTAGGDNKQAEGAGAGGLFRLNLDIPGLPEFDSSIHSEPLLRGL